MANTLFITLRSLRLPVLKDIVKFSGSILSQPARQLYAASTLGLDAFNQQSQNIRKQMANIEQKFREKMRQYSAEDSKSMIFTEDLKNMIHLAETDEDFDVVIRMLKRFNAQNKQLRFGNFVFGPVVMRLFHIHNKPDLALECFKSPEFNGLFDQLITYQILLDLLYENQRYQEILDTYKIIKERQVEGTKYPRNVIVLTMAACYKMNSPESLQFALDLWNELSEAGHFPMRRATTFCAGLALNQGKPEIALEIISSVRKPNYVTIRNIKAKALGEIGRVDDAIVVLKSIISEDAPTVVPHTFNRDVVECIKQAVLKTDNPDISLEFNKLEKLFKQQGHITDTTLDELLCSEIQQPAVMNNRQENRFSRYDPARSRRAPSRSEGFAQRPGLKDMV